MFETDQNKSAVNKTILNNGLTVVSEYIPAVRSVSCGLWIKTGSRDEDMSRNGIAHFLEHMIFKGTKKRSALKIARSLEDLGGSLNAYTSKELTIFYTHSLDNHIKTSLDVLFDMTSNSLLRERDVEMEKQVILEEINAVKDTPDEYIFDLFHEQLFPGQTMGLPIQGKPETVLSITRDDLFDYWKQNYVAENMVLCVAGNIAHDDLIKMVENNVSLPRGIVQNKYPQPEFSQGLHEHSVEPFQQLHFCTGTKGVSYLSPDRFNVIALSSYLGGGMSSQLFQMIREKYGLAYTVYSTVDFFKDSGLISFYLGTDSKNEQKAIDLLYKELIKITEIPLSSSKIKRIKDQLKGSFLLGLESTNRRMTRLAKNEIYYSDQVSVSSVLESINQVSSDSILENAQKLLNIKSFNSVKVGPKKKH